MHEIITNIITNIIEGSLEAKMLKTPHVRATLERLDAVSRSRRKGLCTSKVSKT